jgi:hypothetical protein
MTAAELAGAEPGDGSVRRAACRDQGQAGRASGAMTQKRQRIAAKLPDLISRLTAPAPRARFSVRNGAEYWAWVGHQLNQH